MRGLLFARQGEYSKLSTTHWPSQVCAQKPYLSLLIAGGVGSWLPPVERCAWVLYLESPMKAVVDCEDLHQHIKYSVGILLLVLVAGW